MNVVALNLMIGWQYDLVFVLPLLVLGFIIMLVRGRPLRTPLPDFSTPYDWAERGI